MRGHFVHCFDHSTGLVEIDAGFPVAVCDGDVLGVLWELGDVVEHSSGGCVLEN